MFFRLFSGAKQCSLTTAVERRLHDSFETFSCDIGIEERVSERKQHKNVQTISFFTKYI